MNDLVQQLIKLIRQEEELLEKFLECLNQQKDHIIQNRVENFELSIREEEELINRIRLIEESRITIVKTIARSAGSEEDELTLTRMIEMNLGEDSEELRGLKQTLTGLIERVKKATRVNQYLIKRSLSFIQKNIDWFIDDGVQNTIYNFNGQRKKNDVGNILVDRIL